MEEHPFTWHELLPEPWYHLVPEHTFFAVLAGIVVLVFAVAARSALRRAQDPLVPVESLGIRNIAELLVQLIIAQSDAVIGKKGRKYVPFFATFFFFFLLANLFGLLPGFAPPTGNLNTTIGLALVSFIGYNIIGLREQGMSYARHFVGPMTTLPAKSIIGKLLFLPLLVISAGFFFILEAFSHAFRPVSLSLRLFGNIMGDHKVIEAFIHLTGVVVPVAFYFLGALVSIIQAFVFTLLSMIYVALALSHGHDEGHEQQSHH